MVCIFFVYSGNKQLCSRDVASSSLRSTIDGYSEVQLFVQKETNYDVFCIQSQNRKSFVVLIWSKNYIWVKYFFLKNYYSAV